MEIQIKNSFSDIEKKIIPFSKSKDFFQKIKANGHTIALCHGVFDLLHPGHLRHFAKAKDLADIVVVSITADIFVNKGPGRPAFPENLRAESLANLISVDYVIISPHLSGIEVINSVEPSFYIKGNDYSSEESDKTGNIKKEKETVEKLGGEFITTDEIVFSSSQLINNFLSTMSSEKKSWLGSLKSKYSSDEIIGWLAKISKLKVTVIGETIIDVYTDCETLGKSSKDPILCLNRGKSVSYSGGILAVAANCRGLGLDTTVVTGFNFDDQMSPLLQSLRGKGVKIESIDISPNPTIRKERLIDSRTFARVLELYEMIDIPLVKEKALAFNQLVSENIEDSDVVIVVDYGHGLIPDETVDLLSKAKSFLALNSQTNAGNRGFNSVKRYSRANFITLNGMEAQLETRRLHVNIDKFIQELQHEFNAKHIIVTRGSEGLDIYREGGMCINAPTLAPYVKDRVGAGDVVLTITSLLSAVGAPDDLIGFFGTVVGSWAVTFVGNEKNLEMGDLVRQISAIIK